MRGQCEVKLLKPKVKKLSKTQRGEQSWDGVDKPLFEELRQWRRGVAEQRRVPPYVIMEDTTLMELARIRPTTPENLRHVSGIGKKRMEDFGETLVGLVRDHCRRHEVRSDVLAAAPIVAPVSSKLNAAKEQAFDLFGQGRPLAEVAAAIDRAVSTTAGYLQEYVETVRPQSIAAWVDDATYQRIVAQLRHSVDRRMKPIFEKFNGEVSYDAIRLVMTHQQALFEKEHT
jgi:ATP-dependent DNA helicase RecQ